VEEHREPEIETVWGGQHIPNVIQLDFQRRWGSRGSRRAWRRDDVLEAKSGGTTHGVTAGVLNSVETGTTKAMFSHSHEHEDGQTEGGRDHEESCCRFPVEVREPGGRDHCHSGGDDEKRRVKQIGLTIHPGEKKSRARRMSLGRPCFDKIYGRAAGLWRGFLFGKGVLPRVSKRQHANRTVNVQSHTARNRFNLVRRES